MQIKECKEGKTLTNNKKTRVSARSPSVKMKIGWPEVGGRKWEMRDKTLPDMTHQTRFFLFQQKIEVQHRILNWKKNSQKRRRIPHCRIHHLTRLINNFCLLQIHP